MLLRGAFCRSLAAALFLAAAAGPLRAQDEAAAVRLVILDASRALQANNAALFLAKFDARSMPGFDVLRVRVLALTAQRTIASSVEIGPLREADGGPALSVDWLLQLTPLRGPGPVEIRQEKLTLRFVKRKGKWKIAALEPLEFFRSR